MRKIECAKTGKLNNNTTMSTCIRRSREQSGNYTEMTRRISLQYFIFRSTLSILLFSHAVQAKCEICPNGIENPQSRILYGDGTVSCSQAASIFSLYDQNSCVVTKVDVVRTCCPSQFQLIADNNICGWCSENGTSIQTLNARFRGPLEGMGEATCADLLPG